MSSILERAKETRKVLEKRNSEQEENARAFIREKYGDEWFVEDAINELRGYRLPKSFSEISVGDKIKILPKANIAGKFTDATVVKVASERMLKIREKHFGKIIINSRHLVFVQYKDDFILKLEDLVEKYETTLEEKEI